MQKHIDKIVRIFPDAFYLISPDWEPENLTEAFFDAFCWLRDNAEHSKQNVNQKY